MITCIIKNDLELIEYTMRKVSYKKKKVENVLGLCVLYNNFFMFSRLLLHKKIKYDFNYVFRMLSRNSVHISSYVEALYRENVNIIPLLYQFIEDTSIEGIRFMYKNKYFDPKIFLRKNQRNSVVYNILISDDYDCTLLSVFLDLDLSLPTKIMNQLLSEMCYRDQLYLFQILIEKSNTISKITKQMCIYQCVRYDSIEVFEYIIFDLFWDLHTVKIRYDKELGSTLMTNDTIEAVNHGVIYIKRPNMNLLSLAAYKGHYEIVKLLLEEGTIDPCDYDFSPLRYSIIRSNRDILQLLLKDVRIMSTSEWWLKVALELSLYYISHEMSDAEDILYYENLMVELYTYLSDISFTDKNMENSDCHICMNECSEGTLIQCIQCKGNYHYKCMIQWLLNCSKDENNEPHIYCISGTCPKCRYHFILNPNENEDLQYNIFTIISPTA
jgi:hypothetical protein